MCACVRACVRACVCACVCVGSAWGGGGGGKFTGPVMVLFLCEKNAEVHVMG